MEFEFCVQDPTDPGTRYLYEAIIGAAYREDPAGLRLLYSVLNVSVQGEFQMLPDYETGGSGVTTITTKLGLDF